MRKVYTRSEMLALSHIPSICPEEIEVTGLSTNSQQFVRKGKSINFSCFSKEKREMSRTLEWRRGQQANANMPSKREQARRIPFLDDGLHHAREQKERNPASDYLNPGSWHGNSSLGECAIENYSSDDGRKENWDVLSKNNSGFPKSLLSLRSTQHNPKTENDGQDIVELLPRKKAFNSNQGDSMGSSSTILLENCKKKLQELKVGEDLSEGTTPTCVLSLEEIERGFVMNSVAQNVAAEESRDSARAMSSLPDEEHDVDIISLAEVEASLPQPIYTDMKSTTPYGDSSQEFAAESYEDHRLNDYMTLEQVERRILASQH